MIVKMPRMMSMRDSKLHMTMLNAAPWTLSMPKSERANMTAMFQAPSPPLEGTAMLNDPKTKATSPGMRPKQVPWEKMSCRVKGNAKKAM